VISISLICIYKSDSGLVFCAEGSGLIKMVTMRLVVTLNGWFSSWILWMLKKQKPSKEFVIGVHCMTSGISISRASLKPVNYTECSDSYVVMLSTIMFYW